MLQCYNATSLYATFSHTTYHLPPSCLLLLAYYLLHPPATQQQPSKPTTCLHLPATLLVTLSPFLPPQFLLALPPSFHRNLDGVIIAIAAKPVRKRDFLLSSTHEPPCLRLIGHLSFRQRQAEPSLQARFICLKGGLMGAISSILCQSGYQGNCQVFYS